MNAVPLSRRALLAASLATALPATAEAKSFRTLEVSAPVGRGVRRALVMLPPEPLPRDLPLLVLLHGLGETKREEAGLRAWLEPYGLGAAWERLARASLPAEAPAEVDARGWQAHARVQAEKPFRGLCIVCPFMPNPYGGSAPDPRLVAYAAWLGDALLPAVRARVPEAARSRVRTGVAGVSLGGVAALEVCLRRPELFGCVGTVQGAFSAERAKVYARALADVPGGEPPLLYAATSKFDPYRVANRSLAREAAALGLSVAACERGGAHNQDWLRNIGSLDLLSYGDRALRRDPAARTFAWEPCSEK